MLPPTYYDPAYANVPVLANSAAQSAPDKTHAWKDGGSFGFHDVLDALNPLQHIPVVSTLYRWATGDEPGNVAEIVGDGIYGGPIGLAAGLLSVAFKAETGEDPGQAVVASLTGADQPKVTLGAATPQSGTAQAAAAAAATAAATGSLAAAPAHIVPASVAATGSLVPASTALPMPAAAQPQLIQAGPPHPFLPLYRSAPPISQNTATAPAEQAFIAQNAAFQRGGPAQRSPGSQQTAPIPLQLTGPQLGFVPRPIAGAPVGAAAPATGAAPTTPFPLPSNAATATTATTAVTTASPTPAGTALPPGLPQNAPVDIPQRMMDALDKYARMQQQQQQQQRGQQLDVAP
ncbi:MAG TPA: hypothetical protein VN681_05025 [Stellaceae bacterium]|nr:hypothetical protein [Stellaceae bacterium]